MIRIITRRASLLTLLAFTVMTIKAQTAVKAEILTNKNVVEISKAGLGNNNIISKISASTCKFDLSTSGLIDLKKQGVSEEVISAMIEKTNEKASAGHPAGPATSVKKAGLPVISQLNYVHYYDKGTALPLEKSLGNSKSKRAIITGTTTLSVEIAGATSTVKLSDGTTESFLVNTGGNNVPDLVLYKLKTDKDKRYAIVGKLTISGPKSGEDMMSIEFTKLSDGLYQIKPGTKLGKGEYFFTSKPNLNQSTSSSDVYAFTVL